MSRADWRGTGTVLVVDGEPSLRRLVQFLLEERGLITLTAVDGLVGVELFKKHADEIAAVILDMSMPRMNGEEAFQVMHELRPEIPVVLCSGYTAQEANTLFANQGLEAAAGYIQKPYQAETLFRALRQVIPPEED